MAQIPANPSVDVESLKPFKKFIMTIGNLPTSYLESLTYAELVMWFCNFLQEKVIPAVNNNASAVEELQGLYVELKNYVDNYFTDLDVQEEINNKLDEMVKDGTLPEIVASYLNSKAIFGFDNVQSMKEATNLINGSFAKTLGYYTKNDGGNALYKIRNVDSEDIINNMNIISLNNNLVAELIVENEISIKQFGAKGNGIDDDTNAIQTAINYGFEKNLNVKINSTNNYYLITMPIILDVNRGTNGFWQGKGSVIYGENKNNCRIVKIGNNVYTNNINPNVNNINATFISCNTNESIEKGTGIVINNLSIENYNSTSFDKTSESYALYTNVSRSTYKNLNINSYSGINASCFSCLFENIVYSCIENALILISGTSNMFRFMYAPGCKNAYYIQSSYSTLLNVCCDNGTGTIFNLSGMGLSLINCGCESKKAQYIFKIIKDFTTLKIDNFYMHRQIGDNDNNISLNDCAVLYSDVNAVIDVDNISVVEFDKIDTDTINSSFFYVPGNALRMITTTLKNLRYYKNYTGDKNARMKLWGGLPSFKSVHRYSSPTIDFNYTITPQLEIYPYIGGYFNINASNDALGDNINPDNISYSKTVWLDCKDKYHNENGNEIRYLSSHNKGDVQLYNDPLLMNALGLSITNVINGYTWDTLEIPIVLRGTTEERPTQNLYIGLMYFDTTLNKPIWRKSNGWIDATGTDV